MDRMIIVKSSIKSLIKSSIYLIWLPIILWVIVRENIYIVTELCHFLEGFLANEVKILNPFQLEDLFRDGCVIAPTGIVAIIVLAL